MKYEELLETILTKGKVREDRTGTGTIGMFGLQMEYDLQDGFPLITSKKLHTKSIIYELLWMLAGDTNIKYLNDHGVTIWDEWADENGDLGPVYGKQWRNWRGKLITLKNAGPTDILGKEMQFIGEPVYDSIDQIQELMDGLENNPYSRRHIVSAWNPAYVKVMALPPCHCLFQFYVEDLSLEERYQLYKNMQKKDELLAVDSQWVVSEHSEHENLDKAGVPRRSLSCKLYQRSADTFLGVPYNIASYSFLLHMVSQQLNMMPSRFIWTGGDCHIYSNHIEQVKLQLERHGKEQKKLPTLKLSKARDIFSYEFEDFHIYNYDSHPHIAAPVAV